MKGIITGFIITILLSGCFFFVGETVGKMTKDDISQKVYYNSYEEGWYIVTEAGEKYSRDWYFTNSDDTAKYIRQEREVAEKMLETIK